LLRRAGFGAAPADLDRLAAGSMRTAVASLVQLPASATVTSGPDGLADTTQLDDQIRTLAQSLGASTSNPGLEDLRKQKRMLERQAIETLQLWWLDRMITTPAPLAEKMTLFWHGHFTTAAIQKGVSPAAVLAQNALFRSFAVGNVRELTQRVARDPAMLIYLDNVHNAATHPNENFARELMELFTLGIGNYTEADVREAARAWTGLRIRRTTGEVYLDARLHDADVKTVLGHMGPLDGADVVDVIFQQPAAARFFAMKLLTYFVYADPEPELVELVAQQLRTHDFVLEPVLATLFSSRVFFSDRAYRALVKSPVEFVVGSYRLFGVDVADPVALGALRRMNQTLFYPPNVKGWPGGATWLSTSTILARENFANALMTAKVVQGESSWLLTSGPANAQACADRVVSVIVQDDASPAARDKVAAYVAGSDGEALDPLSAENFAQRMRGAAYLAMAMPAYQLA
jgi:uncharacterized protein (DUF1800 family)